MTKTYMTLKDLRDIILDCEDCSDDTPVLLADSMYEPAKGLPTDVDDLYNHKTLDSFYRLVPSEFIEEGMPSHEKDGAIELILSGVME